MFNSEFKCYLEFQCQRKPQNASKSKVTAEDTPAAVASGGASVSDQPVAAAPVAKKAEEARPKFNLKPPKVDEPNFYYVLIC